MINARPRQRLQNKLDQLCTSYRRLQNYGSVCHKKCCSLLGDCTLTIDQFLFMCVWDSSVYGKCAYSWHHLLFFSIASLLLLLLLFDSNVWFALYFLSHIDTKHNTRYNDNVRLISQNSLNSRVLHMPSIFTHSRLAYTHTHTPCSFRPFLPHSYPVSFLFAFQLFNSLTLIYVPSRKNH